MDMEAEMAKNVEKTKKKYEKLGIDPNTMQNVAKQRTSNINSKSNNSKENMASKVNAANNKKNVERKKNVKYKEGSIAAYANMLSRDDNNNK